MLCGAIMDKNILFNFTTPDGLRYNISKDIFNPVYIPYFFDESRVQIFFGGSSSGKSYDRFSKTILENFIEGRNFLIVRNQKKDIRQSCFNELCKKISMFHLDKYYKITKEPMEITCLNNNRQIMFAGLDNVENVKSVTPIDGTITDVIMEEATECNSDSYNQLRLRQRGITISTDGSNRVLKPRIFLLFNPVSKEHWIYKKFFANFWQEDKDKVLRYTFKKEKYLIVKTTYKDNAFLTEDDINTIESNTDPWWIEVYAKGNFGVKGDVIFKKGVHYFVEDLFDKEHEEIRSMFTNIRNVHQGIDFGINDPHAYVKSYLDMPNKTIYVFDEFGATDMDMEELWHEIKFKVRGNGKLVCERDEDRIIQLKKMGCPVQRARKGRNSISTGIEWLKKFKIVIDVRCKNLIREMETYQWKKDINGNKLDIPKGGNDHFIDALRYSYSHMIIGKGKIKSSSTKI